MSSHEPVQKEERQGMGEGTEAPELHEPAPEETRLGMGVGTIPPEEDKTS